MKQEIFGLDFWYYENCFNKDYYTLQSWTNLHQCFYCVVTHRNFVVGRRFHFVLHFNSDFAVSARGGLNEPFSKMAEFILFIYFKIGATKDYDLPLSRH